MPEQEASFDPQEGFTFVAHDYELKSTEENSDGESLIDKVVFKTASENVPREEVGFKLEVEKPVQEYGRTIHKDAKPTAREIEEHMGDLDALLDKLDEGEYVKITGTITEIKREDAAPYHSIVKNHWSTIEAEVLSGEKREKWKKDMIQDNYDEEADKKVV